MIKTLSPLGNKRLITYIISKNGRDKIILINWLIQKMFYSYYLLLFSLQIDLNLFKNKKNGGFQMPKEGLKFQKVAVFYFVSHK